MKPNQPRDNNGAAPRTVFRRGLSRLLVWSLLVFVGVWAQHRFNLTQRVILLENLWFHTEALEVQQRCTGMGADNQLYRMELDTWLRFTLKPSYDLQLIFPASLNIINDQAFTVADNNNGAGPTTIRLTMDFRRYRDLEEKMVVYLDGLPADGITSGTLEALDGDLVVLRQENLQISCTE